MTLVAHLLHRFRSVAPGLVSAVASSWALICFSVAAQAISVPLYLAYLSTEEFGLTMMLNSFVVFSSFAAGGIWNGGTQYLGECAARNDEQRFAMGYRAIRVAFLAYGAVFVLLLFIGTAVWHPSIDGLSRAELWQAAAAVSLYLMLWYLSLTDRIALVARKNIVAVNTSAMATQVVFIVVLPCLLLTDFGLSAAPLAYSAGIIASQIAIRVHWRRLGVDLRRRSDADDSRTIWAFLAGRFGFLFQAHGMVSVTLSADTFILGLIGGPLIAAQFALLWKIAEVAVMILSKLSEALQPYLIHSAARGDRREFRAQYLLGLLVICSCACLAGAAYAIAGPSIVALWVGASNVPDVPYGFALAGAALALVACSRLPMHACMAQKKLDLLVLLMFTELLLKFTGTVVLLDLFGAASPLAAWVSVQILGVAVAYQVLGLLSMTKYWTGRLTFRNFWILPQTAFRLGVGSIVRVLLYRLALVVGYWERRLPIRAVDSSSLWREIDTPGQAPRIDLAAQLALQSTADDLVRGDISLYGQPPVARNLPLQWQQDPISLQSWPNASQHWSRIDYFNAGFDIKNIWDTARFWWAPALAGHIRVCGSPHAFETLVNWSQSFFDSNPVNRGPQWSCGQETSIRAINLLLTAQLLGQDKDPQQSFIDVVVAHGRRVRPTISYAIGQMNNHAISEGAGLFVIGEWLLQLPNRYSVDRAEAASWAKAGRRILEQMVIAQIASDGAHLQRSLSYQRVVVDTLSLVEAARRRFGGTAFSDVYYSRVRSAVEFLFHFVEPTSGHIPQLGPVDGSRGFDLSFLGIEDYRPTVQLAMNLFADGAPYGPGPWDAPLLWLEQDIVRRPLTRGSRLFSESGYAFLQAGRTWGVLVLPRYRVRAAHADGLHLDIWRDDRNWLADAGTSSYYNLEQDSTKMGGVWGHNTVSFDDEDQMLRLSRFLYAGWPTKVSCDFVSSARGIAMQAEMTDWKNRRHARRIELTENDWTITDSACGDAKHAHLQWLLTPAAWKRQRTHTWETNGASISILSSGGAAQLSLEAASASRYYGDTWSRPALIGTAPVPAAFVTRLEFRDDHQPSRPRVAS